jgi:hypothetical protein
MLMAENPSTGPMPLADDRTQQPLPVGQGLLVQLDGLGGPLADYAGKLVLPLAFTRGAEEPLQVRPSNLSGDAVSKPWPPSLPRRLIQAIRH